MQITGDSSFKSENSLFVVIDVPIAVATGVLVVVVPIVVVTAVLIVVLIAVVEDVQVTPSPLKPGSQVQIFSMHEAYLEHSCMSDIVHPPVNIFRII